MRKPSKQESAGAAFIAFFCVVLALPGLLIGEGDHWDSLFERRNPAEFPQFHTDAGDLNPALQKDFEAWLNDHIGLRSEYIRLKANVYTGFLQKTSSDIVYIGREGWYFFSSDHNIELATGEYPLDEADLSAIARNQQAISDWYAAQGIDYVLLLTQSKTTVYPEYLYGDYTVGKSPVDIVEQYLKEHTDVVVVNTKPALLDAKESGEQVYWKADSHWTSSGSYAAYKALLETLNHNNILVNEFPVSAFTEDEVFVGEMKRMLGDQSLFGSDAEVVSGLSIEQQSQALPGNDAFLIEISEMLTIGESWKGVATYNNPAKSGTLLLYGDSLFQPLHRFPVFMAEHYGNLVYAGIFPQINLELDERVEPDTVVFTCTERLLIPRLTDPQNVPRMVDNFSFLDFPETHRQQAQMLGMFESLDGNKFTDDISLMTVEGISYRTIGGWAFDDGAALPLSALYCKVGDTFIQCNYGYNRPDVADYYDNDALENVGYQVAIPSELLQEGETISFIAISADGSYRLPEQFFATVLKGGL
jgi:hypothetical protein